VHLAVFAEILPVGLDDSRGVMIKTGSTTLEEGGDEDNVQFLGELTEGLCRGTGDRFRELEIFVILTLAEIFAEKKFRQADYRRTLLRSFPDEALSGPEVF